MASQMLPKTGLVLIYGSVTWFAQMGIVKKKCIILI